MANWSCGAASGAMLGSLSNSSSARRIKSNARFLVSLTLSTADKGRRWQSSRSFNAPLVRPMNEGVGPATGEEG